MDLISQVTLLGGASDRATLVRLRGRAEVDAALRGRDSGRNGPRALLADDQSRVRTSSQRSRRGPVTPKCRAVLGMGAEGRPHEGRGHRSRARAGSVAPRAGSSSRTGPTSPLTTSSGWSPHRRRTLVDCMRNLPLDESLPIVNSAIRADDFTQDEVTIIAHATRGRGRARICAVADVATGQAANPFESVLHSQALLVPGLSVIPQLEIPVPGTSTLLHPDLGDPLLPDRPRGGGFRVARQSCPADSRLPALQRARSSWGGR